VPYIVYFENFRWIGMMGIWEWIWEKYEKRRRGRRKVKFPKCQNII
jgi:hypothetical protein